MLLFFLINFFLLIYVMLVKSDVKYILVLLFYLEWFLKLV